MFFTEYAEVQSTKQQVEEK